MAVFSLEALDAGKGDALVLHWGPSRAEANVAVIDGGVSGIYRTRLGPRLAMLAETVDLAFVLVSHVDDDHIHGVIDLAQAMAKDSPPPATIQHLWHNSFHSLLSRQNLEALPASLADKLHKVARKLDGKAPGDTVVAQSFGQGRTLAVKAGQLVNDGLLATEVNDAFGGLVVAGGDLDVGGMRLRVLAPDKDMLQQLADAWPDKDKDADARAQMVDDPRVENLSSIAVLVEFAKKSMLLTGDIRRDHLIAGVDRLAGAGKKLRVSLLKLPHHGSSHSIDAELFERVVADHYVVSGNGEHGNPHPSVIQMLYDATAGRKVKLHVTNWPKDGAEKPLDKKKAKEAQALLENPPPHVDVKVRPKDKHGIAVHLGSHKASPL